MQHVKVSNYPFYGCWVRSVIFKLLFNESKEGFQMRIILENVMLCDQSQETLLQILHSLLDESWVQVANHFLLWKHRDAVSFVVLILYKVLVEPLEITESSIDCSNCA